MGRVATSLAGVIGAAALVAVPISISAAAPPAAVVAAESSPSTTPGDAEYNNEAYWVAYLEARGYTGVECEKFEPVDDPFIVPELEDEGRVYVLAVVKAGSGENANELYWDIEAGDELSHQSAENSHVILCSAEEETETSSPPPTTSSAPPTTSSAPPTTSSAPPTTSSAPPTTSSAPPTTSSAPPTTSSAPPTTSSAPPTTTTMPPSTNTGPPVETDRPVSASATSLLGAAAALVAAGIAAMAFARRRQGNHR